MGAHAEARIHWAFITLMSRRPARPAAPPDRGIADHPRSRLKISALLLPFGTATIDAQPNGKRDHYHPSRPVTCEKMM
ncbi:hypothetical protein [Streptomyces sp. TLI_185]|uniref:hypothetical protein n=1 Tax=Streptomyces sp. TLI_185 TaxID=2485151 RepID=UPI000F4D5056|nr:hypothetical protein [Streptomyces sp. TLI_185]